MMNLDQQLKILIKQAPEYGIPAQIMEQGVIPIIEAIAKELKHSEYYILETEKGEWILTTLNNRSRPQQEKKAIYAFANQSDANLNSVGIAKPIAVTHLLFQMFALQQADSIIFMDNQGDSNNASEVNISLLRTAIEKKLEEIVKSRNLPPNIA